MLYGNYLSQQQLNGMVNAIRQTPTGSKLYNQCVNNGIQFVARPNDGDDIIGYFDGYNTIYVETDRIDILAHEMLHGATPQNGNSMQEEKLAFMLGEQVQSELTPGFQPQPEHYWANFVNQNYSSMGIPYDNGIKNDIASLGINMPGSSDPYTMFNPPVATMPSGMPDMSSLYSQSTGYSAPTVPQIPFAGNIFDPMSMMQTPTANYSTPTMPQIPFVGNVFDPMSMMQMPMASTYPTTTNCSGSMPSVGSLYEQMNSYVGNYNNQMSNNGNFLMGLASQMMGFATNLIQGYIG